MNKLKVLSSILAIFSLLLLSIVVTPFFVYLLLVRAETKDNERTELFRYYQKNTITNESSVGIVTLSEDNFGENEFFTYHFDGSSVLISNFDTIQYECGGKCVCQTIGSKKRSSLSSSIIRPIFYLVASASSAFAYQVAKEYFDTECESHFSYDSDCLHESSIIRSEIGECIPLYKSSGEEDFEVKPEDDELDFEKMLDFDDHSTEIDFFCSGNCLESYTSSPGSSEERKVLARKYWNDGDCERLKLELMLTIPVPFKRYLRQFEVESEEEYAVYTFTNSQLQRYCMSNSQIWIPEEEWIPEKFDGEGKSNFFVMCSGDSPSTLFKNPSVKCVKMGSSGFNNPVRIK